MSTTALGGGVLGHLRARRRASVKRFGKRALRALTAYLSRQSRVPDTPVLDPALFPWSEQLRDNWTAVRAELDRLLVHRDALPRFQDISPDQARISTDDRWRTVMLYGFQHRAEATCRRCPETDRLLAGVPRLETAFFSILAPGKHIPCHRGVTKGMIRCHLGLVVPDAAEKCAIEVGGVRCSWAEGELLFFDDTYPHEVWNDTDQERAVLFIDFERPMTLRGRLVSRLLLFGLRRTAYFKDARRNQAAWEAGFDPEGATGNAR